MNNIGNIKDTIPITNISNFPIPIWDNVKAKIAIILLMILLVSWFIIDDNSRLKD